MWFLGLTEHARWLLIVSASRLFGSEWRGPMSSQAQDLVLLDTKKTLFFLLSPRCTFWFKLTNLWSEKTQASFPSLAASWILIRAQSWVLPEQWAYTDAFLAAGWPTCDYWNCNLSLAFRWSEPCSGQIRRQSASDHWPLGANLNEFQLEILKNAVSQAQGNLWYHSDSRRQRQKWQQLQHGGEMQAVNEISTKCTFNRLTIVKNYEKIWILRRVSLW